MSDNGDSAGIDGDVASRLLRLLSERAAGHPDLERLQALRAADAHDGGGREARKEGCGLGRRVCDAGGESKVLWSHTHQERESGARYSTHFCGATNAGVSGGQVRAGSNELEPGRFGQVRAPPEMSGDSVMTHVRGQRKNNIGWTALSLRYLDTMQTWCLVWIMKSTSRGGGRWSSGAMCE